MYKDWSDYLIIVCSSAALLSVAAFLGRVTYLSFRGRVDLWR